MNIKREIAGHLDKLKKSFRVVVITGPRQSGKTTLMKRVLDAHSYCNLEDLGTFNLAKSDPSGFINQKRRALIDEIQRVPELLPAIQVAVDERNKRGDFILSGSQNLLVSEKISQSLAGRAAYLTLLPLTIAELKASKLLKKDFTRQIYTGFYPAIYSQKINPTLYYGEYVATYVERDLREIKNIHNLNLFRKFLGLLAGRIGQLVNCESLGNDTGVAAGTVENWLSILEASYLIYRLRPYYANIGKRLVKAQKIYFTDTGLACYLLGIADASALATHYLKGGLFENLCIMEIRKQLLNRGVNTSQLYFYRDSTGNEVDLVIEWGTRLLPVEIKAGGTYQHDFSKGMNAFKKAFAKSSRLQIEKGCVIYTGEAEQQGAELNVVNWKNLPEFFTTKTPGHKVN